MDRSAVDGVVPAGALRDPDRLDALRRAGLLDEPADEAFERATRLASRVLGTPVSLVSLVDDERQFFAGQTGLGAPYDETRQTPLTHSFCQYVVASEAPLAVADARKDPILRDNLAIPDLGVVSYLGLPIRSPGGYVLGSFCVISDEPRAWTPDDVAVLEDLLAQLRTELRLRAAIDDIAESARLRRDLLEALAHDVRSPAGTIVSVVRTLRNLPEERREAEPRLLDSVERLAGRITALSQSLLELGEGRTSSIPVALPALVEGVLESVRQRNRLSLDIENATIVTDASALAQLMANLVDNALKHTAGDVTIELTTSEDAVRLVVRDEGPGSEPEELAELFRPFTRGMTSASGHGLGLYIVARLVERLGGELHAETGPDRGTTVSIRLPLGDTST